MSTRRAHRAEHGFTLIEMLVVIAIIAILAAMLYPSIEEALFRARMVETLNNGRGIYHAVLAAEMGRQIVLPATAGPMRFATSTEYFRWMITNKVLDASFAIFSAFGLSSYAGLDPARFTANENAWCVAADVGDATPSVTPVLFTRNLEVARLNDPLASALTENVPFGTRGVVVVTKDGGAAIVRPQELQDRFNPGAASNVVLRP